ncbi:MAG: MBL fold metallo-hydrolase [Desulfuromonadales bacterium]|nr:MBL fold metallo-hydrolase [Desulfuromonadales bacterium]NIR33769.1 MBL fold metallo-hydrolase [Desulfuromonadales bacterium]NIS39924.1 MBL fold metallo-hydrolase [Desulfuromonadales bacterium]
MELTILGSGTSTGIPVIGCDCPVCNSKDPRDNRTRCSALVRYAGKTVLIDTATDFRQQALREGIARVDAVLFTHAHADHVHGLDDLRVYTARSREAIPIYGADPTLEAIGKVFSYIFDNDPEAGFIPRLETREAAGPFELFGRSVTPIPLHHGGYPTQGYRIGSLAYLTDCNGIPDASWELLEGLDTLVLDGLRLREHSTHFNIAQAVEKAEKIGARRTLLTHLSHEVDHERISKSLPQGIELAYDGQKLTVADR